MQLSKECKLSQLSTVTAGAAGTSTLTSSALDMADFDGVLFIVPFGAIVSGSVTTIKAQQSDDDGASDAYSDIEGTSQSIADTADDTSLYMDIFRPQKRYLKIIVTRATQNATTGGVHAIQYGSRKKPTTHAATYAGEAFVAPAEGTA